MNEITEQEREAIRFLEQDYGQCYEQLRLMDNQIIEIIKFLLSMYVSIIGVAIGLSNYFGEAKYDFLAPVKITLLTVFIIGIFILWFVLQRRIQYVKTARYLNEQRKLFLDMKPLGFDNKSRMHVDINQETLNWQSSHMILAYIIAILNGILMGTLIFISLQSSNKILVSGFVTLVAIFLQVFLAGNYLHQKDKKGRK
jgi:membrane protein YdbS with pleckstrin-like domain